VVDDAIRFVCQKFNGKQKPSRISNDDKEESIEPDYNEDEDQLEEEQEEQLTSTIITNQVF
jgi:hypothetical protein